MYEIIKQLCYENNITISKLCEMVTNSTGNLATWKKDYMRSDYLKKVADYFQVSTDYLLGREEKNSPTVNLKADEQELLKYYSELCDIDKGKVIGVAKALAEFNSKRENET